VFSILTNAPTGAGPHIRIRNDPAAGRNTAREPAREGVVEAAFLWPLVKGEDVRRWEVAGTDRYIFVPYLLEEVGVSELTLIECAARAPRLLHFLQPWLGRYQARSMYRRDLTEAFPWALSGPTEYLTDSGALVFVRYLATGGRPAAAVREAQPDQRLGRSTLPLPNNKSNIYYTGSVDEAHFVAAFINSEPAQAALARFAVSTGVTPAALARLPLPRFDVHEAAHVELANLGSRASEAAGAGEVLILTEIENEINEAVTDLAG
jgi:hypothetical protein